MYWQQIWGVIVSQNFLKSSFSSATSLGLCLSIRKFFMEPHTCSVGFKSGLSAGLFHQLMLYSLKKA